MDKFRPAGLHSFSSYCQIVLALELLTDFHKLFDCLFYLFLLNLKACLLPVVLLGCFERDAASALDGSSFDKVQDVVVKLPEARVGDGGNFSFLIDEDAKWSLLCVEIKMQLALSIHDVEVFEACVSSLSDGCLLL